MEKNRTKQQKKKLKLKSIKHQKMLKYHNFHILFKHKIFLSLADSHRTKE